MPGVRVTSLRPKGKVRPRGGLFAWEKGRGGPQVRWRMQRGGAHAAVGKTEPARSARIFSGTASRASKASGQKSQQLCKDSWCKTKYFGGLRSWQRACFGSAVAVSGTGQGEMPQSLAAPAFAGFPPVAENGTKAVLTTGMTTDRKIFIFITRRGIMEEIEYR